MNAFAHIWYYIPILRICQCVQGQKTFFVQGVDKSIFWVYDALVKAKASLSIKLLDAFAFFIFLANPEAFIHAAIMCSPSFSSGFATL